MRYLARWPLMITGIIILGYGVIELADTTDRSDARAFVLGLGSTLVGAGIVMVVQDKPSPPPPTDDSPDRDAGA